MQSNGNKSICQHKSKSLSPTIFCRFDGWGKHDCERTEAAGVICKPMPPTTTPPPPTTTPRPKIEIHKTHGHYLKARLSGGRDQHEGTYHGENLICITLPLWVGINC